MENRIIMLFDMQSFYASVEKVARPEYRNRPLVVAGDLARRGSIILAACPIAKSFGISTANRLWEALQKCPGVIVRKPQMQRYIDISIQITDILETFTDLVEPYSIDEQFIDVTSTLHLFKKTPEKLAIEIQAKIQRETGIFARAGIAENKLLAKVCCDLIAKRNKTGIFTLNKEELHKHIWHFPVEEMWGVGSRMKGHLNQIGIRTIGDLAKTPIPRLTRKWGVNGQVLWQCANGVDDSLVTTKSHDNPKAIGNGITLPREYVKAWEVEVVLLDIVSQICRRCRNKGLRGSTLSVICSGMDWDKPKGFSRQAQLLDSTNITEDVYLAAKALFHRHWDGFGVRKLRVTLSGLEDDTIYQLTLFEDQERKRNTDRTMDCIRDKFGETAIVRASSFTSAGQTKDRVQKIGGHYK